MTLPGPEDGHLRMPNWLVERLAKLRLNGTQWQILWAVWRRTLCWQHPGQWGNRPWPIGTPELADACGINTHQVKREMSGLLKMNIIIRNNTPGGRGHKPITAFNLVPSTWKVSLNSSGLATLNERVTDVIPITEQKGSELVTPTMEEVEEKGSGLVPPSVADSLPFTDKSATLSVPNSKLLKKHINKQKETSIVIFDFWNSLKIITHKNLTSDMKRAIDSTRKDYSQEEIEQAMRNYAVIVKGTEYYFNHRWTLAEFLSRRHSNNIERFLDLEVAKSNFKKEANRGADRQSSRQLPKDYRTPEEIFGNSDG